MEPARDAIVVACSLEQHELSERRQRWQALSARALIEIVTSQRGLPLIVHAGRGVEHELYALAALERECCAFADWSVRSTGEEIELEISGASDESIAAVHGMFGTLRTTLANP